MIHPATKNDLQAIQALLDQAFAPSRVESKLVESLVAGGFPIWHWVLEDDGMILGYICYSQAYRGGECIGYHLAPVAVVPEQQGKGLGSKIIRETLNQQPLRGRPIFVVGDPAYYTRFGFRQVAQPRCPFDPGNEHFMALRYADREDFEIGYEPAFFEGGPVAAGGASVPACAAAGFRSGHAIAGTKQRRGGDVGASRDACATNPPDTI